MVSYCSFNFDVISQQFLKKMENPFEKKHRGKITFNFLFFNFYVLTLKLILCSFLSFDCFFFNFGTFLKFWGNPEFQDGGSKIGASSPPIVDLKGNAIGGIFYPQSIIIIDFILTKLFLANHYSKNILTTNLKAISRENDTMTTTPSNTCHVITYQLKV